MKVLIDFTIPGRVGGKERPRFAVRKSKAGKAFAQAYTPKKTVNAEALIRQFGEDAMAGRPPFEGPLSLEVSVFLHTTKSWSKKKKAAAVWATGRPDCDNTLKLIGDALNNIVWGDDSQIALVSLARRYNDARPERVVVVISAPEGKCL